MQSTVTAVIEPLIKRRIFNSPEEAVRELVKKYILEQINSFKREISHFERKYGMSLHLFHAYLHERSVLLQSGNLVDEPRQILSRAVMLEEDDYQEWQAATDLLESWLGLGEEIKI